MERKHLISVIVACFNEEEALPYFYNEVTRVAAGMPYADFEFLFVNDGSSDGTLNVLRELASRDERVRYISFSRNFGKESAMLAGLKNAKGDFVTMMDADLQDPPALMPELYKAVTEEGFDAVGTRRSTRTGEPKLRSLFANLFYKIVNKISKTKLVPSARDYFFMSRRVVNSILSLGEYNRFTKGIFNWVGYKVKWVSYDNIERVAGKTKWSFWKLFKYSIDCIVSFTTVPLVVSAFIGAIIMFLAFAGIIVFTVLGITGTVPVLAWPLPVSIISFLLGIVLTVLGIVGVYLSKEYTEIKKRPMYLESETEKDNPLKK